MAVNDPISDYLTRIRNAQIAGHRVVDIPASNLKKQMTEILYDQGFIYRYKFEEDNKQGIIKIALKYNKSTREPIIQRLQRASKPGLRVYRGAEKLPRVINGYGIAIISTSQGLMTDKQARKEHIGGEVLCYVY